MEDIDLMLGGVAEKNVRGGAVGATFACIIGNQYCSLLHHMVPGEQFKRIKFGDRYFYTHRVGTLERSLRQNMRNNISRLISFIRLFQGGQSHGLGRVTKSFVLQRWVPAWQQIIANNIIINK